MGLLSCAMINKWVSISLFPKRVKYRVTQTNTLMLALLAVSTVRSAARRNPACCVHCTALFYTIRRDRTDCSDRKERQEANKAMTALQGWLVSLHLLLDVFF